MQGDLSQDTLAGVIRGLYLDRKSGILHLEREGIEKRIYFKKGSMIFANSDVNDDRIGEFLIRNNAIDRAAFEMAVKVAKDTRKHFGKTIVEMGHMSAEEMETQVTGQIEAIIYSLFLWESGDWKLEPHEDPVDADIVLNLSTADIILEGIRRMTDFEAIGGRARHAATLRKSSSALPKDQLDAFGRICAVTCGRRIHGCRYRGYFTIGRGRNTSLCLRVGFRRSSRRRGQ